LSISVDDREGFDATAPVNLGLGMDHGGGVTARNKGRLGVELIDQAGQRESGLGVDPKGSVIEVSQERRFGEQSTGEALLSLGGVARMKKGGEVVRPCLLEGHEVCDEQVMVTSDRTAEAVGELFERPLH
jgi:hypothetical protein